MTNNGQADAVPPKSELRHYPVAVSVEQLALAWLRSEGAQSGSIVLVDHEIGPRQRLGVPWRVHSAQSVSYAAVLRCRLPIEDESLLWITALLAAARSFEAIAMSAPALGWPDLLIAADEKQGGSVAIEAQLGPGIVQSAIVSVRINTELLPTPRHGARPMAQAFGQQLNHMVGQLETTRADLLSEYDTRSALIGRRVRVRLLPRGDTRGTVGPVTAAGNLPLVSPTGMIELLDPSTVLSVVPI